METLIIEPIYCPAHISKCAMGAVLCGIRFPVFNIRNQVHMKLMLPAIKTGLVLVGMLTAATFTTGCATMFSGTVQNFRIESDPPGATVMIKNENRGKTPLSYSFPKDRPGDGAFRLELEGYVSYAGVPHLTLKTNPMSELNVFNLFICNSIDIESGAAFVYDDIVHVRLLPISKQANPPSPLTMHQIDSAPRPAADHTNSDDVYDRLQKLKDLKDKGIITEQEYEARRKPLLEKL